MDGGLDRLILHTTQGLQLPTNACDCSLGPACGANSLSTSGARSCVVREGCREEATLEGGPGTIGDTEPDSVLHGDTVPCNG